MTRAQVITERLADDGATFDVAAGDVLVIPAGVAHKNLGSSSDFVVVGAYPKGQEYDMNFACLRTNRLTDVRQVVLAR